MADGRDMAEGHKPCTLLPGLFGVFVQGVLFLACVSVLVFKKKREERSDPLHARSWPTFLLDSSKQLIGSGWVHVVNLICAAGFGASFEGDGCQWYWVNIMVDTTIGVGIEYLLLWCLTEAFESLTQRRGTFISGDYKDESGQMIPSKYIAQLAVWLLCATLMKLSVVLLMILFHREMSAIAHSFLELLPASSEIQLVVVMVITPVCMNAFQLWVTDAFLKKPVTKRFDEMSELSDQFNRPDSGNA